MKDDLALDPSARPDGLPPDTDDPVPGADVAHDLPPGQDPRRGDADASIEEKTRAAHVHAMPGTPASAAAATSQEPTGPAPVQSTAAPSGPPPYAPAPTHAPAAPAAGTLGPVAGRRTAAWRDWPVIRIFTAACTVAVGFVLVWFGANLLREVTSELLLIVLSAVVAAGLDPVVSLLTRRGLPRPWSVTVVATTFLLFVVGFFATIVPPIVSQTEQLIKAAPQIATELQDRHTVIGKLNTQYHLLDTVTSHLTGKSANGASGSSLPVGGLLNVSTAIFGTLVSSLTVIVLTIYFLANMPAMRSSVYRMVPASRRERAVLLGDEILARVGGYVLGNIITSVVAGAGTMVFLEIVGVPYAGALGLLVAVLDLIPIIGSTIGGTLVTLVALTVSLPIALASLAYYIVYRLLEDYLLTPRVMNRTVHVPPVLTIVALLIGGALFGIEGAFLAIPVAAALELVITEVVWPKLDSI